MRNYRTRRIVIFAGTHGKAPTTSMITRLLLEGNCDPTISVGGMLDCIGGNIRVGKSDSFVTEACEYTNKPSLSFYHANRRIEREEAVRILTCLRYKTV